MKLKQHLAHFTLLSTIIFGQSIKAEEMTIPKIESPSALLEGTQRRLSAEQIAELLPWAKNSKLFLTDLLEQVQGLPLDQKVELLTNGIQQVVIESAPKQSELIMRYSLNRAMVILDILNKEMDANAPGTVDAKIRVLTASAKFALKYYDADVQSLSKKAALPYADFGKEYFNFLHELNKSIFDASAQYNVERAALEFYQWDLYRDLNNTQYAPQILKINNALKIYPTRKIPDTQSISYIRQMKKLVEQLELGEKRIAANNNEPSRPNQATHTPQAVLSFNTQNHLVDYDGFCRAVDKNGRMITTEKLPAVACAVQYLNDYDGYCRAVDKNGRKNTSEKFPARLCASKYLGDYDGNCRAYDSLGRRNTDEKLPASLCASKYLADYEGYCRAIDSAGRTITSDKFPASQCTRY